MTTNMDQQRPRSTNGSLPEASRPPWGWFGVGIIALSLVYWLFGRGNESVLPSATPEAKAAASAMGRSAASTTLTLPGGATLVVPDGSTSSTLARFLAESEDSAVPRAFAFDGGHFAADSSALTSEAEQTVKDVSAILAAYPTTTLHVRGYADTVDNVDADRTLALDRAEAVKRALVNRGIDGSRLTTTDGRHEQPLSFNTTKGKRSSNPHIVVIVMAK